MSNSVPLTTILLLRRLSAAACHSSDVVVADFDNDGLPDLAISSYESDKIGIQLGNRNGSFRPMITVDGVLKSRRLAVADYNHDGKQDLAVTRGDTNPVSILFGLGDGHFYHHQDVSTPSWADGIVPTDINEDGQSPRGQCR